MPNEFLVGYDYGNGGLWAVVLADSVEQITNRYPEVVIVSEPPPWMDDLTFERFRRDPIDINAADDEGIFKAVVASRSR